MVTYHPHKTAIWRKPGTMTTPSKWLLEKILTPRGIIPNSVLDFGAGKSHDTEIWRKLVRDVRGYDKHPFPGFEHRTQRPKGHYELVTMNYVLNVLATKKERAEAMKDASLFVADGGHLWVSTRSKSEIAEASARGKEWERLEGGGWLTPKGTVQFGMDREDITSLASGLLIGFTPVEVQGSPNSATGCALFRRLGDLSPFST